MMGRNAKRPAKGRLSMHPGGEGDHLKQLPHHLSKYHRCHSTDELASVRNLTPFHPNSSHRIGNDGSLDGLYELGCYLQLPLLQGSNPFNKEKPWTTILIALIVAFRPNQATKHSTGLSYC